MSPGAPFDENGRGSDGRGRREKLKIAKKGARVEGEQNTPPPPHHHHHFHSPPPPTPPTPLPAPHVPHNQGRSDGPFLCSQPHPTNRDSGRNYNTTLRPRRNGQYFADDILKHIFFNWISINITLKFVPKCPINSIPALVQMMAWAVQATSRYLNQWWLVYRRIYMRYCLNAILIVILCYRVSKKTVNPFKQLYFMNQSTYLQKLNRNGKRRP